MADQDRKSKLLNFVIDPAVIRRIDDYRYRRRFPTRAAAIKHLLDFALDADPPRPDPPAQ